MLPVPVKPPRKPGKYRADGYRVNYENRLLPVRYISDGNNTVRYIPDSNDTNGVLALEYLPETGNQSIRARGDITRVSLA